MIVLLTGAAGLLGGAIADDLTRRGHGVIGLVHRASDIRGNDGSAVPNAPFDGTMPASGQMRILRGNIAEAELGLDKAALSSLGSGVDCVIHCAAMVRFEAEIEELKAVNVGGTRNAAHLFPKARFIHVSTAYSCGLKEGVIGESLHSAEGQFGNGYEQSKAMAELELIKLRPDAVIARPSIILGEHETGRIRSFDTIYAAFKLIAEGRIKVVPVAPNATLNFVPIDHVVAGIAALTRAQDIAGEIVHLAARKAISAEAFLRLIGEMPGLCSPEITRPSPEASGRPNMMQRLVQPYLSYFTRSPQFATTGVTRLTGLEPPDMDKASLLRHIEFCVASGFIKPRAAKT